MHAIPQAIARHLSSLTGSLGLSTATGAALMSMLRNISTKLLIGILSDQIGAVNICTSMNALNVISLVMTIVSITSQNTVLLMTAFLCLVPSFLSPIGYAYDIQVHTCMSYLRQSPFISSICS
ncbi:MAG: hypothetical protein ACI32N_08640 [Bulleidia sp.]